MSRDDPFGSGGKTVIRPNPGGARPSEPRIDQSRGIPPGQAQPAVPQPTMPQYRPAQPTGMPGSGDDDWLRGGTPRDWSILGSLGRAPPGLGRMTVLPPEPNGSSRLISCLP